jgi:transglutaminase-like putative cysteine protease
MGKHALYSSASRRASRPPELFSSVAFVLLVAILSGCVRQPGPALEASTAEDAGLEAFSNTVLGTREYEVLETLTVTNKGPGQPSKHNLWIALIQDIAAYQTVTSIEITPDNYQMVGDEYGNRYAEFDLADMEPGTSVPIEIRYRVAVNELSYDLSSCEGELPTFFTEPELHVESGNPQIVELAQALSKGERTACDKVEAFYNHIGDRLVYSYNGANWGAQAALGPMGADCTEYASLMMALSRAEEIPARYLEGIRILNEGAEQDARIEHAWLEVYLPGSGWTPMDPTLGRSSLNREAYFAQTPADRVIVTRGRNPSTLRGASYFSHLYWPGATTEIRVEDFEWDVTPVGN